MTRPECLPDQVGRKPIPRPAIPSTGRWIAIALLGALLGACSSPIDLVARATDPGSERDEALPRPDLGRLRLVLVTDRRSLTERGSRRPGGRSYLGTSRLSEPLEVAVLKVIGQHCLQRGWATEIVFQDDPRATRCEVRVATLHASWTEGLENLTVVLPTSRVLAEADLSIRITDPVGRTLATARATGEESGFASALGDPEEEAVEALARLIQRLTLQMLDESREALTPPRASRSSTAR